MALCCSALPARGAAPITWNITFDDAGGTYQQYYAGIQSNFLAAANEWASHLVSVPRTIDVEVRFLTTIPRSSGHSVTSGFVQTINGVNVFEQGFVYKLQHGTEPQGITPDVYFDLNPTYLSGNLWFDPDPTARTAPVPNNRTDAVSVILHELAHAIVFNGWRDGTTGALPGTPPYESTFDLHETFDGSNLYFTGPRAEAVYGGPVPITYGNNWHVGNNPPRPGSSLLPDLMNGVVFYFGHRYDLSALDLAMATDSGTPTNYVPGDANADGSVGFDDLLVLAQHYGTTSDAALSAGDFNTDFKVDFNDLLILAQHYGQSYQNQSAIAAATAVPEPGVAGMAFAACAAALCLSRRGSPSAPQA